MADQYTDNELFNIISGSAITGESTYDIWKSLGNEGTVSDFIEYMRTGPQGIQGPQGETGPQPALIDNLTSTSTIEALTANQGKILSQNIARRAYVNGVISDSLLIGLSDPEDVYNLPYIVTIQETTVNPISDCQIGIREVFWINNDCIIARVTGLCTDMVTTGTWISVYSGGTWIVKWQKAGMQSYGTPTCDTSIFSFNQSSYSKVGRTVTVYISLKVGSNAISSGTLFTLSGFPVTPGYQSFYVTAGTSGILTIEIVNDTGEIRITPSATFSANSWIRCQFSYITSY